jgi:hypothetical protein
VRHFNDSIREEKKSELSGYLSGFGSSSVIVFFGLSLKEENQAKEN